MKFTILSHAGLKVKHGDISLITDPWLIGSCYWRSWWNFPEPPAELLENLRADFVYLTHLHWDHYHGPSLRKFFSADTTFLLPKVCTTRMMDDLRTLGFSRFVEIAHGDTYQLGPEFSLCSYQFGIGVDSAAFIKAGNTAILNANDCKLFGRPLRHLLRKQGRPDFVLRSHSSASPVPYCVADYKQNFSNLRTQENYIEEFARFAISVNARHAIPFASNHCFLHGETSHFNDTAVSPDLVERYCNQLSAELNKDTRCVVMSPGSSWSEDKGFELLDFDFGQRPAVIAKMAEKYAPKLAEFYAEEEQELADFDAFKSYFDTFLAAVPWLIRKRWKPALLFRVIDQHKTHRWLVEPATRTVKAVDTEPADAAIIEVPPRVINDCSTLRMFSAWTPSKRLKIFLPEPQALGTVKLFFSLVDAWELDNLPLRRNLRPRNLGVFARRWREGVEALSLAFKHKVLRRPFRIAALYPLPGVADDQRVSQPEVSPTESAAPVEPTAATTKSTTARPPAATSANMAWITVASIAQLDNQQMLAVECRGHQLALFKLGEAFHAIEDRCSHRQARLSEGRFDGNEITCPLHGARFDVRDGTPKCLPAKVAVACYEVRVVGEEIQIAFPADAAVASSLTATEPVS